MLNTPVTPPRVPIIDPRTNLIDRAWYMFFVSLSNTAGLVIDNLDVGPSPESLVASYDAALQALAQEVNTQPATVDLTAELVKQIEAAGITDTGLLSMIAEIQKQIDALNSSPIIRPPSVADVSGLGTMAIQNANSVVITGGTINGVNIGNSSAGDGTFDVLTANVSRLGNASGNYYAIGTLTYTPANALISVQSAASTYNQIILQNSNGGASASADFIVNNDLSTDSTYYGDFGMNSSTFAGTGSFNQPNYVYLTAKSTDLAIGTIDANSIHFVIGSGATDAMTINTAKAVGFNGAYGTAGQVLTSGGASAVPTWTTPTTGTVTSVSVVSANGFAGSSSGGATPALTLSTSITGVLKGNGTAISAAVVNTDYFAPSAPVTKTADFTVAATDVWLINNKSGSTCTATLPAASSWSGRVLRFQNYQTQTLVSASSNVVPLAGGAASTSILLASAGDSATLVSDGSNWLMTQYVPNNILLLE